jgi:hypothetical protein
LTEAAQILEDKFSLRQEPAVHKKKLVMSGSFLNIELTYDILPRNKKDIL